MTEAEWLKSPDALAMLRFLGKKASGRKLRLFAVACARRIWPLLTDDRSRRAVDVAEQYADRQVTRLELTAAEQAARAAAHHAFAVSADNYAALVATETAAYTAPRAAYEAAYFAESINTRGVHRNELRACHAELLRDIFGNPFRAGEPPLMWRTTDVIALAQAIYSNGTYDRLPILADALEEVGCTDATLLAHLRGPGPHVRGCFAVDLCLGRA